MALFVNVRNAAITSTIIQPKQGNALEPSIMPELKGGFVKNRTDAGTNLAVNFHFMPYRQDSMNHMDGGHAVLVLDYLSL